MQVLTDDPVFEVDSTWLGPEGMQLPWRATYRAYAVGFVIFVLALTVERRIGMGSSILGTAWTLLGTVAATRYVMRFVSSERTVRSLFVTFVHEVTAPRHSATAGAIRAVLVPGKVRVR